MTNEIKEILAYFEEYVKITDMHDSEPMLNWKDLKIVLDYIANLQEENKKLKDDKDGWHLVAQRNYNELLDRIDKALEKLDDKRMIFKEELIDILRGDE